MNNNYEELEEAIIKEAEDDFDEMQDEDTDEFQEKLEELKSVSKFYEFVIDDIIKDSDSYDGETEKDKILARCNEILEHGCVSGTVGSLVYYSDTVAAFNEYADDIYDLIDSYDPDFFLDSLKAHVNTTEIILNCDTAKNWIVWIAYEEVTYQLQNALEEL